MPADILEVAPIEQVKALEEALLDLLEECISFAADVEETEAECGAMSLITIQRHLAYLRRCGAELRRVVQ